MDIVGNGAPPGDRLQVTIDDAGDGHPTRISLHGELDLAGVARVREAIDAVLAQRGATDITVDMAELTFCDSTGLTEFIRADRELRNRGRRLRLRRPTVPIQQILNLTHLDATLDVDD